MAEHTPTPWGFTYDGSSTWSIGPEEDPQDRRIATVQRRGGQDTWEEAAANAALIVEAVNAYETLVQRVEDWRKWAQFVYLGGGPVTASDADLRSAVCEAHDKTTATLVQQRDALVKSLRRLIDGVDEFWMAENPDAVDEADAAIAAAEGTV